MTSKKGGVPRLGKVTYIRLGLVISVNKIYEVQDYEGSRESIGIIFAEVVWEFFHRFLYIS